MLLDVLRIQFSEIHQPAYRHIGVVRALMLVQIHGAGDHKGDVILHPEINRVFNRRDRYVVFVGIIRMIDRIIQFQRVFLPRFISEQGAKQPVLVFLVYICHCHFSPPFYHIIHCHAVGIVLSGILRRFSQTDRRYRPILKKRLHPAGPLTADPQDAV